MVRPLLVVALAVAGFAFGRQSAPVSAPPPDPCPELTLVEAEIARTRQEIEGTPAPFPAALRPGLAPADFIADLEKAKAECPELLVGHVDCDEYPCMAWVRGTCPALARFTPKEVFDAPLWAADGAYLIWDAVHRTLPPEQRPKAPPYDTGNLQDRMETRRRAASERIVATTGGRRPTQLEIALHERDAARRDVERLAPTHPKQKEATVRLKRAQVRVDEVKLATEGPR